MNGLPFTDDEKAFVQEHYLSMSHKEIGLCLGRSRHAIRNLCYQMQWRKKPNDWTDAETETLREHYSASDVVNLDELAQRLGRLRSNICRKARELGLTDQSRVKTEQHKQHAREAGQGKWSRRPHPRGALGHKDTPEQQARRAEAMKLAYQNPHNKIYTLILRKIGRVLFQRCKMAGVLFRPCKIAGVLLPKAPQTVQ